MSRLAAENDKIEKTIKCFSVISMFIMIIFPGFSIGYFIAIDEKDISVRGKHVYNTRYWVIGCSVLIICLLTFANCRLIKYLSTKEQLMGAMLGDESDVFQKEKTKLLAILFMFITSVILDILFIYFLIDKDNNPKFTNLVLQ